MSSKRLLLIAAVALVAEAMLVGPASGRPAATISLVLQGHSGATATLKVGATATVVARASLRKGDRISIVARRANEKTLRSVAVCKQSPCVGKWLEKTAVSVRFSAIWRHSGAADTGSRTVTVSWKKAPPPAFAVPGHYEGKSSQNELFAFDVSADGRSVVNLKTGQINTTCKSGARTSAGNLNLKGPYVILPDHTFSVAADNEEVPSADGKTVKRSIAIKGNFSGAGASGSLLVNYGWPVNGSIDECSSGDQTWTIPRVG